MNWHEPTQEEINGTGDHRFLVDIFPGEIPHQAATDGDALIRVGKPGWTWQIVDLEKREEKKARIDDWLLTGMEDTREAAIGAALAALIKRRS